MKLKTRMQLWIRILGNRNPFFIILCKIKCISRGYELFHDFVINLLTYITYIHIFLNFYTPCFEVGSIFAPTISTNTSDEFRKTPYPPPSSTLYVYLPLAAACSIDLRKPSSSPCFGQTRFLHIQLAEGWGGGSFAVFLLSVGGTKLLF